MRETDDFQRRVVSSIRASIAAKEQLLNSPETVATIARVSEVLVEAMQRGNKVLLFGNGGSAADAQHIAAEFVGRFAFDRPALPALALSVNTSCVTAIGNDYGFDLVFSRQIEALGRAGDVAIGISTSGNSPNVVRGWRRPGKWVCTRWDWRAARAERSRTKPITASARHRTRRRAFRNATF